MECFSLLCFIAEYDQWFSKSSTAERGGDCLREVMIAFDAQHASCNGVC